MIEDNEDELDSSFREPDRVGIMKERADCIEDNCPEVVA
jgi:hypothetical protein